MLPFTECVQLSCHQLQVLSFNTSPSCLNIRMTSGWCMNLYEQCEIMNVTIGEGVRHGCVANIALVWSASPSSSLAKASKDQAKGPLATECLNKTAFLRTIMRMLSQVSTIILGFS